MPLSERQEFKLRRSRIEGMIESAKETEQNAKHIRHSLEHELHIMQRNCKHEDAKVSGIWQGGGLYYENTHCPICNKKGDRYSRALTLKRNLDWYENSKTPEEIEQMTPKHAHRDEYNW